MARPKPPKVAAPSSESAPEVSKYQSFTMARVCRTQIKGAEYNPRVIDEESRTRLRNSLKKLGLAQPLIWNKRTGVLVGGHQRLSILDDLEDSGDFYLDVAVVDLSPEEERSLNLVLNNPSVGGQFDFDKVVEMLKVDGVDPYLAGFTPIDLEFAGVEVPEIHEVFKLANQAEEAQAAVKELQDIGELKATRKKHREASQEAHNAEFFGTIVFKDGEQRSRFMAHFGLSKFERYIEGGLVAEELGIALDKDPEPT